MKPPSYQCLMALVYGTGFAGSLTYSSNALPRSAGGSKASAPFARR
jgi:hypothetical protein